MKGKITLYSEMPNLARFRSRVEAPSSDLTTTLRGVLNEVVADIVNHNTLQIRAEFIKRVQNLNLVYKSEAHAAAISSVLNNFFDVVVATTSDQLNTITASSEPADSLNEPEASSEPADDFEE